jgi:hypothetical protein
MIEIDLSKMTTRMCSGSHEFKIDGRGGIHGVGFEF